MEISPLICSVNQWTGFYMISASVVKKLKQKHPPESSPTFAGVLLPDQPGSIHQIKYEIINVDTVRKAALKKKVVLVLRGWMHSGWKRIQQTICWKFY